ncbi:MAG: CpaF family protein, partial [Clostridiaceae bacterium]|nr:CpaF family protein [Clostridiaceae bacterium]
MADIQKIVREIRKEIALSREASLIFNDKELDSELLEQIESLCFSKDHIRKLSVTQIKAIVDTVFNQMRRHDIIEPLINDPAVTEIMINGPDRIFIERKGVVEETKLSFDSKERLDDLIQNIVARVNRTVNEAEPIVDARLSDGSRVNIVLPPIALNGPLITIRKFPEKPMTMD